MIFAMYQQDDSDSGSGDDSGDDDGPQGECPPGADCSQGPPGGSGGSGGPGGDDMEMPSPDACTGEGTRRLAAKLAMMEDRLNSATKWNDLNAMGQLMQSFMGDPAFYGCVMMLSQAAEL